MTDKAIHFLNPCKGVLSTQSSPATVQSSHVLNYTTILHRLQGAENDRVTQITAKHSHISLFKTQEGDKNISSEATSSNESYL